MYTGAGIAEPVKRIATVSTVRESNPGGCEFFRTRPDRPCGPPSLLYNGYRVIPGVERPRRGADHPPPYSAEVKEGVELYLYSPSGLSLPVLGRTLPLPFTCVCVCVRARIYTLSEQVHFTALREHRYNTCHSFLLTPYQ
jgi:hypothetical protein